MAKGDARKFLGAFLRNPTAIGAIAPSSTSLARAMVRGLQVAPGQHVVEFGPGTGAFTAAIHDMLPEPSCYLGIELEPSFVTMLAKRFPDLRFVQGSAADAATLVTGTGITEVIAVVSGLPFASLSVAVQDGIVASLDELLGPSAVFRTFQYVHAYVLPNAVRFRRRMGEIFGEHERSRVVLRNLPPAYALSWQRKTRS